MVHMSQDHTDSPKRRPFGLTATDLADAYRASVERPPGMPRHVAYLHRVEEALAKKSMTPTMGALPIVIQYEAIRNHAEDLAISLATLCGQVRPIGLDTSSAEKLVERHVYHYVQGGD